MGIRRFIKEAHRLILTGLLAFPITSSAWTLEGLHYGVRTDTFQPIHSAGYWLWYSDLHTQIPSLDKHPHFWLINLTTGVRSILTPYFVFGVYGAFGQLHNHFGKTYIINSGIECWFPWTKLGIHAYFLMPQLSKKEIRPIEQSALIKRAIDIKLSGILLPFVRPFLGVYYLSKFNHPGEAQDIGSLNFSWGVEWLITPKCSLEARNDIGKPNLLVQVKLHSAKVRQPTKYARVTNYMQEPVDQYALPVMRLSPDTADQAPFWKPVAVPSKASMNTQPPQPAAPIAVSVRPPKIRSSSLPSQPPQGLLQPQDDHLIVQHPSPSVMQVSVSPIQPLINGAPRINAPSLPKTHRRYPPIPLAELPGSPVPSSASPQENDGLKRTITSPLIIPQKRRALHGGMGLSDGPNLSKKPGGVPIGRSKSVDIRPPNYWTRLHLPEIVVPAHVPPVPQQNEALHGEDVLPHFPTPEDLKEDKNKQPVLTIGRNSLLSP